MPFHKIVVMGDRNVGKTALSMMYVYGRIPPEYRPTTEDVYIKSLEQPPLKGKGTIYLHFWDTSGTIVSTDPDDRRTRFHYYNIADVVMLVYDAQNEESQQKVDSLKTEINTEQLQGKKPSIFVVENRSNSSGNYSSLKQSSDSNSSIPPITPDWRLSTLQKNEVDTCIEQMLQVCQLGVGSSGNSIKRAPSRTSVHSMSTIKSKVLQK